MPNKILPPEKLSVRDKIIRKIQNGEPFTIDSLRRSLRPREKYSTVYYHVTSLINELRVERITDFEEVGTDSKHHVYQWCDGIQKLEQELVEGSVAEDFYNTLLLMSQVLREGNRITQQDLSKLRIHLEKTIDAHREELNTLTKIYNCHDFWEIQTLVERLQFRG